MSLQLMFSLLLFSPSGHFAYQEQGPKEETKMTDKWKRPIEVGFGVAGYRVVTGPFEAMICLIDLWPNKRGPKFIRARNSVDAALAGRGDSEQARSEFLACAHRVEATVLRAGRGRFSTRDPVSVTTC